MKGFLRNLFQKTGKSTEPLPEQEKKERPPNGEDGYMRYCIELEQALRDLETYLLTVTTRPRWMRNLSSGRSSPLSIPS